MNAGAGFTDAILRSEVSVAETLSDIAYRHITKKLMTPEMVAGQKISEQQIASECGISRTPVRQAVRQLIEEGLLYQVPRSGTYVSFISRSQIIEAYEVRMAVECFLIEKAVRNLTLANRQDLRRLCEEMHDTIRRSRDKGATLLDETLIIPFLKADLSFHLILLHAAKNQTAIKIVTNAYQRNQFFGHHSHRRDLQHLAWAWRYHAKIEKAIRLGDVERARKALRDHITRSMNDALKQFDASEHHAPGLDDPVNLAVAKLTGIG